MVARALILTSSEPQLYLEETAKEPLLRRLWTMAQITRSLLVIKRLLVRLPAVLFTTLIS